MVPVLRELTRGRRGDVALAALAAVVQIGGTTLTARHHAPVRTLDVYGYLLLAAGPAALLARRSQPVPVLMLAFATTLGYVLLGYPGGPIWMTLIVAFGTALMTGHRIAAYGSLLAGYLGFLWLPVLTAAEPPPSAWAALGLAAWFLVLLAGAELIRNRRAFAQASRQRASTSGASAPSRPAGKRARNVCASRGSCTTCSPTTSRSSTCRPASPSTSWTSSRSRRAPR